MNKAIIVKGKTQGGRFGETTKRTGSSQRETLESIIINLSTCLGINEIHKLSSARGGFFYDAHEAHHMAYQSASNTILELSELLLKKHSNE